MHSVGRRWYVVTRGLRIGIFNDWYVIAIESKLAVLTISQRHQVQPLVNGVSGATQRRVNTYADAVALWNNSVTSRVVQALK
jgi:hypothetical protein